ncbi:WD repeat-containing protein 91-like [Clavelina lepadiformis]|uniref:WD repeat-containing protein 91-like n=1 Tax=Clavelina lepadiformis TaxID=159417 RepID=UPI0040418C0F
MPWHPKRIWAQGVGNMDRLIRDYLLQRGFNNTLKAFDLDIKQDKDKGFRPDKVIQYVQSMINSYDVESLRSYWNHLHEIFFSQYDKADQEKVKKIEYSLYRYYAVICIQNGKKKECGEFFEKMNTTLLGAPEWKEWFPLPFTPHPENHKYFAPFFTKQWQDTFLVSFHNFLSAVYNRASAPELIQHFLDDQDRIELLQTMVDDMQAHIEEITQETYMYMPRQKRELRANYIRAMNLPGSMVPEDNVVFLPRPQKKKSPFSFAKKSSTTVDPSIPVKPIPTSTKISEVKQSSSSKLSAKLSSSASSMSMEVPKLSYLPKKAKSSSAIPSSSSHDKQASSPVTNLTDSNLSPGEKKLSNYQMQRRELMGVNSDTPSKENEASSKDDTQSSLASSNRPSSSSLSTSAPLLPSEPTIAMSVDETSASINQLSLSNSTTSTCQATLTVSSSTESQPSTSKPRYPFIPPPNYESLPPIVKLAHAMPRIKPKPETNVLPAFQFPPSLDNPLAGTLYRSHIPLSADEYQEHHSAIIQCRFDATGDAVASCDKDGVVKVWRCEPSISTIATVMSRSPFLSLDWCKSANDLLILGTSSSLIRIYNPETKLTLQDIKSSHTYPHITQISSHPSGNMFATTCVARSVFSNTASTTDLSTMTAGSLQIWSLKESNASLHRVVYESADSYATCLAHDKSGLLLACGDSKGNLTLFDTRTFTPAITVQDAHNGGVYTTQFTTTEKYILTLGADGKFFAWDKRKIDDPVDLPLHKNAAGPFEISGYGGYKQVHDPSGGKLFALEPDGKHVLTCDSLTGLVYELNVEQQEMKQVLLLKSHSSPVTSVDWASSINCGHCLSGSMDGKINVATLLNQ